MIAGELGMKRFAVGSSSPVGIAAFEAEHAFLRSLFKLLLATEPDFLALCMEPRRPGTARTAVPERIVCCFSVNRTWIACKTADKCRIKTSMKVSWFNY